MFTAFAFWMAVRRRELPSGFGPPSLTAIAISFPKRVNCTAIFAQRLNFRSFLNSKALPIVYYLVYSVFRLSTVLTHCLGCRVGAAGAPSANLAKFQSPSQSSGQHKTFSVYCAYPFSIINLDHCNVHPDAQSAVRIG